jgi:hypothetical protein
MDLCVQLILLGQARSKDWRRWLPGAVNRMPSRRDAREITIGRAAAGDRRLRFGGGCGVAVVAVR